MNNFKLKSLFSIIICVLHFCTFSKHIFAMEPDNESDDEREQPLAIIPYHSTVGALTARTVPHQAVYAEFWKDLIAGRRKLIVSPFIYLPPVDLYVDLRLPVYITPECLFCSFSKTRNKDTDSSSEEESFSNKITAYGVNYREQGDYIRLENIRRILKGSKGCSSLQLLRGLSWQVDGMNVFRKLLRDRHKIGLLKEAEPWELLAFLHHGLSYPEVSDRFVEALMPMLQPFINGLPKIIDDILVHEKSRSGLLIELLAQVKNITREIYGAYIRRQSCEEDDDLELFIAFSNEPEQMFDGIGENPLLSPELQFHLSWDIAFRYATLHQNWDAVDDLNDLQARLRANEILLRGITHPFPESLSFTRLVGILYEFNSLKNLQRFTATLREFQANSSEILGDISQAGLVFDFLRQTIVYFGEALDDINTPLAPDLAENDDVLNLRYVVKWLRNYFEHPEINRHEDLSTPSKRQKDLIESPDFPGIAGGILHDLIKVGDKLEKRLALLESILCYSTDMSTQLAAIVTRPPLVDPFESELTKRKEKNPSAKQMTATVSTKRKEELLNQLHWALKHPLSALHQLRRYFVNPSYDWLPIPIAQDDLNAAATAVIAAEKDKTKDKIFDSTLEDARSSIGKIRRLIGTKPAQLLNQELTENMILRFTATSYLQQVHYVFDTIIKGAEITHNMKRLNFYIGLRGDKRDIFEQIYLTLQDRRNMLIHDLWREDSVGLTNILMLLVHVFDPLILESLEFAPIVAANQEEESDEDNESSTGSTETDNSSNRSFLSDLATQGGSLSQTSSLDVVDGRSEARTHITIRFDQEAPVEIDKNLLPYRVIDQEEWEFINTHPNPTELLLAHFEPYTATPQLVNALLLRGANIDAEGREGYRPIHFAIINRDRRMLKLLLKYGANPNVFDQRRNFPLHLAAENDDPEAAQLLLNYGAAPMPLGSLGKCTPYDLAVLYDHFLVRALLQPFRSTLRGDPANRLIRAVTHLEVEETRSALSEGGDVNLYNEDGELPLVQALTKIDHVSYEQSELAKATTIVTELREAGADVTFPELEGKHALSAVSVLGKLDIAQCIYDATTEVSIPDNNGDTALHMATHMNNEAIVADLLKRGARVNAISPLYGTPLLANARHRGGGSIFIQQMLLARGANPNYQNEFGWSALHYIAEAENLESTLLLLRYGANPFLTNRDGETPRDLTTSYAMQQILNEWMRYLIRKLDPSVRKNLSIQQYYPQMRRNNIAARQYVWNIPGQESIHFEEGRVAGDGNCAFTALGTDRESAIDLIQDHTDMEWVRNLIRPDLLARIIDPDDGHPLPLALSDLRVRYRDRYSILVNMIEERRAQVNQGLGLAGNEGLTREQVADHIEVEETAQQYRDNLLELNTISNEIEAFNPTPDQINIFLENEFITRQEYLTYHLGGGGTLEALVRLRRIGVTILMGENNLEPTLNISAPAGVDEHYYLHHTGMKNKKGRIVLNHFNLLYR